jgi:hypothetical protein
MGARAGGELWTLFRGALATRALAIAADLGIADLLADGPCSAADLAEAAGADADALHRMLRALASEGVFVEEERGVFANSEASELLREGSSGKDFAHLFGGIWHRPAGELRADGAATFARVHGADFWSWLESVPDERRSFDRAMATGSERRVERLAALEWQQDEVVVDVGGGNGSLLRALLDRRPGLRGVVLDLPETTRDDALFEDRLRFAPGSFFERVPTGDAYILATILHDWDDEDAARILRTIWAAAPAHARLLVLDAVIPEGNAPHGAKWLDLLMLALFAGRERDEEQWRELLTSTGFEPVRVEDGLIEARCR